MTLDATGTPTPSHPILSDVDQQNIQDFEGLLNLMRAKATTVALGLSNGLYITGRPGIGKTFTVEQHLKKHEFNYTYVNCRVSPAGLHKAFREHPENIFVIDDVTSIFEHKQGKQLLLAALGGEPGKPRKIEYVLKGKEAEPSFLFYGGVIAISNLPLRRDSVTDAVASRVQILNHEPSDELVESFMRHLALKGHKSMTSAQCMEVTNYLIEQSRSFDYRLDLRRLRHAFSDYQIWSLDKSEGIHWTTLVDASLHKAIDKESIRPKSKKERMRMDLERVQEALIKFTDRSEQIEYSGLSPSTFNRRLANIKHAA